MGVHWKDWCWSWNSNTLATSFGNSLMKSWLIGKDPDAGKDWGQEKGMTEDEIVGWRHWLNGHGFWWTPGVGDGQGGLACCNSWGYKEMDMTELLNWTEIGRERDQEEKHLYILLGALLDVLKNIFGLQRVFCFLVFFLSLQVKQSFVKAVSSLSNWMILNKPLISLGPHLKNGDYINSYFCFMMLVRGSKWDKAMKNYFKLHIIVRLILI